MTSFELYKFKWSLEYHNTISPQYIGVHSSISEQLQHVLFNYLRDNELNQVAFISLPYCNNIDYIRLFNVESMAYYKLIACLDSHFTCDARYYHASDQPVHIPQTLLFGAYYEQV